MENKFESRIETLILKWTHEMIWMWIDYYNKKAVRIQSNKRKVQLNKKQKLLTSMRKKIELQIIDRVDIFIEIVAKQF